jgi:hypothetical protein
VFITAVPIIKLFACERGINTLFRPRITSLCQDVRDTLMSRFSALAIHTSPGPAQNPHTPTQPTAAAITQPKPRSSSHYGTEFERGRQYVCRACAPGLSLAISWTTL